MSRKTIRVLSYNFRKGFSFENWEFVLRRIKESVDKVDADVVLLREAVGHHGNAILSRYPIAFWENQDISPSRFERRALLHAAIDFPGIAEPVHVICAHLALFESDRTVREDISQLAAGASPGPNLFSRLLMC